MFAGLYTYSAMSHDYSAMSHDYSASSHDYSASSHDYSAMSHDYSPTSHDLLRVAQCLENLFQWRSTAEGGFGGWAGGIQ